MRLKGIAAMLVTAILIFPIAGGADDSIAPAKEAGTGTKSATAPLSEAERNANRRDTIRYGIDSEIMDLIKTLGQEKTGDFNDDLYGLFQTSRSPKLRIAILDFYRGLEWKGAEDSALDILENRDLNDSNLISATLAYLATIRSTRALAFAPKIIEEDDKRLLPALVGLIGRVGGKEEETLLLEWLAGDAPTESLRQETIRALGEIGSGKAADALAKIAESSDQGKVNRMYACEALGKIGDVRSIPSIIKAANSEDPNVRASAIEAIASFGTPEAEQALMEAFRDSYVKVRMAACKGVAKRKLAEAIPILCYKAEKDPEKVVKTEAFRALSELGGVDVQSFLEKYFENTKNEGSMRSLVFGLILRTNIDAMAWLTEKLAAESIVKDRAFFTALSREVSSASESINAAPLVRILLADKDYLFRLGGLEWVRKTKAAEMKPDLVLLAEKDASEFIRKRAAEILAMY